MKLEEDDELVSVVKVKDDDQVFIATSDGKAIRIEVPDVRCMGRATTGVKGIELSAETLWFQWTWSSRANHTF